MCLTLVGGPGAYKALMSYTKSQHDSLPNVVFEVEILTASTSARLDGYGIESIVTAIGHAVLECEVC